MKASVELEHRLWQSLTACDLADKKILVGFSGGVDSLALLWALHRTVKQNVVACYVHHGPSAAENQQHYRQAAAKYCENFCKEHGISFELRQRKTFEASGATSEDQILAGTSSNDIDETLYSEASLRSFRLGTLWAVKEESGAEVVALAHHQDDLLETRMHRLIRGTGAQGLQAMEELKNGLFRPFLKTSKQSLQEYLGHYSLKAFEDPSNQSVEPFRNWLRQEWLPALETRQAGALKSLARSLELLAESASLRGRDQHDPVAAVFLQSDAISRLGLTGLAKPQQRQAIARLVFQQNKRDFTQNHIEEVLKRLDNPQKELMFRVGGVDWYVNAQQIKLEGETR